MSAKKNEWGNCEACGDELSSYKHADLQLAPAVGDKPAVVVRICGKQREYLGPDFRAPCARKIRAKYALCPGCGANGYEPGDICKECLLILARARTSAAATGKVKWYPIDDGYFFSDEYLSDSKNAGKLADELVKLLVRALQGTRRSLLGGFPKDSDTWDWGAVIPSRGRTERSQASSGMAWVEMDEEQAAALDKFSMKLRELGGALVRLGFQQGDDLLRRLGSGDVKPDDYEQWRSKKKESR